MEAVFILALLVFVGWLIPTLLIWAINVLLIAATATPIAYSPKTWFAMLLIIVLLGGIGSASKD